jgi:hypothetical protein
MVAAGGSSGSKKLAEALLSSASQVHTSFLLPSVNTCIYVSSVEQYITPLNQGF